jgi:beta-fructofuranosidase
MDGPWRAPAEDGLDGRGFYAAKTATDGNRRYAFGWIPTRYGQTDSGAWEWAGDLAVHELIQRPDGALASRLPGPVRDSFTERLPLPDSRPVSGDWKIQDTTWKAEAPDSFAQLLVADLPAQCKVTTEIRFQPDTQECGLMLRATSEPETGYYLRLEPHRKRFVLDSWPRTVPGQHQWQVGGDKPHAIETERSIELDPEAVHHLEILIDGPIGVAYLDDEIAMSFRMYDRESGALGIFVADGSATFTNIEIVVRSQSPEMAK